MSDLDVTQLLSTLGNATLGKLAKGHGGSLAQHVVSQYISLKMYNLENTDTGSSSI